jgi:hypothetical protein
MISPITPNRRQASRPTHDGVRHSASRPDTRVAVTGYDSLIDLRRKLLALEPDENRTVVLALDDWFSGSLTSILKSERICGRLVITSASGALDRLSGLTEVCGNPEQFGWTSIEFIQQPVAAVAGHASATLLWPTWACATAIWSQLSKEVALGSCELV